MYSSRPARPPSAAYQYNPQAVDDVDDRDNQEVHDLRPGANIHFDSNIQRKNSGSTYNPLEVRQDYGYDGPYVGQPVHDGVHGTYGDGGGDPTEGGVDENIDKFRKHPLLLAPGSNYKPTPLRWPFLATLMALMVAAIALIVYAHVAMPDSQSTAVVRPGRRAVVSVDLDGLPAVFGLKDGILRRRAVMPNDSHVESSVLTPVVSLTSLVPTTSSPTLATISTTSEGRRPVDDSGLTTISQGTTSTPTSTSTLTTPISTSTTSTPSTSSTSTSSTSTSSTSTSRTRTASTSTASTITASTSTASTSITSTTSTSSTTSSTSSTSVTSTTSSSTTSTSKTSTTSTTSTTAKTSTTTTPTTVNNAATPTMFRGPLNGLTTSTTSKPTTPTTALKGTGVIIITTSTPIATMTPTSTIIVVSTGMTQVNSTMVITHSSSILVTPSGGGVGGGGSVTFTSVIVTDTTATITFATATVTSEIPFESDGTSGATSGGVVVSTLYSTSESVGATSYTSTWVEVVEPTTTSEGPPHYVPTTSLETVTSAMSVPFTTTETQTTAGHPYIVYGQVTITSSYTIAGGNNGNNNNGNTNNGNDNNGATTNGGDVAGNNNAATHPVEAPVTHVITTVVGGKVDTIVQTVAPQTHVQTVGGGLQTTIAGGVVETIVTRVGATPVTYVHGTPVTAVADGRGGSGVIVVVTPSPTAVVQTAVVTQTPGVNGDGDDRVNGVTVIDGQTVVNGATVTVIDGATFVPQFSTVGGSAVTAVQFVDVTTAVVTTGADGLPTTQVQVVPTQVTSVATVGGTVMTVGMQTIDLQTVAENVGQTVVTVDGTVKTVGVATVAVTGTGFQPITVTEVTLVNGTPSTTVVVTTPTVSDPITFTVAGSAVLSDYESYSVSMSGGSLVTIVRTRPPTTIITPLSGHLTTFVSTPPPSTLLSTEASSTLVSTAVSLQSDSPSSANRAQSTPSNAPIVIVTTHVLSLQPAHYFMATFLPAFVAVLLSLPLRVIDLNAKMYQPFHALSGSSSRHHNAHGSESLTLAFSGLASSIAAPVSAAWNHGEPVPLLTTILVALSSFLAPLATEALGLKLHGSCSVTNESGCAGALGVSVAPAYALVGLLSLILALLLALLILLQRWRTGLRANPWNLAGIAALTACPDLLPAGAQRRSRAVATEKSLRRALEDRRFALGFYETANGHEAFGIVPVYEEARRDDNRDDGNDSDGDGFGGNLHLVGGIDDDAPSGQPFLALTVAYRAAFAVFLAALLTLVVVYHVVAAGAGGAAGTIDPTATRFGDWVATNSFGVRFAMAALGVAVSFCWTTLFLSVAAVMPFQAMATPGRPQPPERSILLPLRLTNEFSGLWVALRLAFGGDRFRGNNHDNVPLRHAVYLGLVSLMTLASEFLPVLLANVPYNVTQTLQASVVCARLVAVVLVLMLLTLLASFVVVRWPALPADPRTIAGAMYYVVDSHVLPAALAGIADTTGGACVALMDTAEKTARVRQLGRRCYYGDIVGRSGRRRLAVDADVTLLDPVVDGDGGGGGGGPPPMVTTAYKGGAFYVYNHEARYQRQQQEEEPPFI